MIPILLCPQQQSHKKHDVVWCPGDQRACSENLQEPGAESATGGVCGCEATHISPRNNKEVHSVCVRHDNSWAVWCLRSGGR